MGFAFDHVGWSNLFANGNNYVTFSIMGMLIVFAGLTFISIYITLLPKILDIPNRMRKDSNVIEETEAELTETKDSEMLLAIAVALHLDQTGSGSYEKITWKRPAGIDSSWLTAGRMRGLAVRSHLPDRRS